MRHDWAIVIFKKKVKTNNAILFDYYVGKTKRHLKKRFFKHHDVSKPTAVSSHMMAFNRSISFDDVKVMATGISDTELLIKESLIITKLEPSFNAYVCSFPLEMFS